jgi:hypothetical protein
MAMQEIPEALQKTSTLSKPSPTGASKKFHNRGVRRVKGRVSGCYLEALIAWVQGKALVGVRRGECQETDESCCFFLFKIMNI